eukprot:jgi/Chrpa1/5001/Chrysochromulina_OHIO_Genome00010773-RA
MRQPLAEAPSKSIRSTRALSNSSRSGSPPRLAADVVDADLGSGSDADGGDPANGCDGLPHMPAASEAAEVSAGSTAGCCCFFFLRSPEVELAADAVELDLAGGAGLASFQAANISGHSVNADAGSQVESSSGQLSHLMRYSILRPRWRWARIFSTS